MQSWYSCRNRSTACCLFASRDMSIFVYYKKRPLSDDDLTKEGGFPTYIRLPIHAQWFRFSRTAQYTFHRRSLIMIPDDAGLPHSNNSNLTLLCLGLAQTFLWAPKQCKDMKENRKGSLYELKRKNRCCRKRKRRRVVRFSMVPARRRSWGCRVHVNRLDNAGRLGYWRAGE